MDNTERVYSVFNLLTDDARNRLMREVENISKED